MINISVLVTYPLGMIKGWSLDNQHMLYMIILWKVWTVVILLSYIKNEFRDNKKLVRYMNQWMIKSVHVIIDRYILITSISIFLLVIDDKYIVD